MQPVSYGLSACSAAACLARPGQPCWPPSCHPAYMCCLSSCEQDSANCGPNDPPDSGPAVSSARKQPADPAVSSQSRQAAGPPVSIKTSITQQMQAGLSRLTGALTSLLQAVCASPTRSTHARPSLSPSTHALPSTHTVSNQQLWHALQTSRGPTPRADRRRRLTTAQAQT